MLAWFLTVCWKLRRDSCLDENLPFEALPPPLNQTKARLVATDRQEQNHGDRGCRVKVTATGGGFDEGEA